MWGKGRIALACALSACLVAPAVAEGAPALRLTVPSSGATVATLSRADGGFPFRADAARDRAECLSSPKAVPLRALRRILGLARGDRDGAFVEANRAVARCMEGRGWRMAFCGRTAEPPCPEGGLAWEPAGEPDRD